MPPFILAKIPISVETNCEMWVQAEIPLRISTSTLLETIPYPRSLEAISITLENYML
jgi:hypothetical protein